jgi:hypothetical protein
MIIGGLDVDVVSAGSAMANLGYEVHKRQLTEAALDLAQAAERLRSIRQGLDEHARLTDWTFGPIGYPAAVTYRHALLSELDNLDRGIGEAERISRSLHKSAVNYQDAETASVRSVLDEMGRAAESDRPAPRETPPATDNAFPSELVQFNALAGTVMFTGGMFMLGGIGRIFFDLCNLAKLTEATYKVMISAGRICVTAMVAGGLWFSLVVPDDVVINEAISAWNAVASAAREIFDADVPQVRDAVQNAWKSTEALPPADRAIEDFIAAGIGLADRAEKRAETLRKAIEDLNTLHMAAFWVGTAELMIMVGCEFAAGFYPPAMFIKEKEGLKLVIKVIAITALVSSVIAGLAFNLKDNFAGEPTEFARHTFQPS